MGRTAFGPDEHTPTLKVPHPWAFPMWGMSETRRSPLIGGGFFCADQGPTLKLIGINPWLGIG